MSKIAYAAVVLDRESHDALEPFAPPGWDVSKTCHHCTLAMGPWKSDPALLGQEVSLLVLGFAIDSKVCAFSVELPQHLRVMTGALPHVTVATGEGGKPFMAGKLDLGAAQPVTLGERCMPRVLRGQVREVAEGDYSLFERTQS